MLRIGLYACQEKWHKLKAKLYKRQAESLIREAEKHMDNATHLALGGLEKLVQNLDTNFSLDEIDRIDCTNKSISENIFETLCARHYGPAYTKDPVTIASAINSNDYDDSLVHHVWDNLDSFIRTVCEYDHAYLFKDPEILENVYLFIDNDYLDDILLAPKPAPIEIEKDAWHGMTMELIDRIDEIGDQFDDEHGHSIVFSRAIFQALSYSIHDTEGFVFFETVSDLIETFNSDTMATTYHSGMLEPAPFDLLREYGPAFVKPLLERQLDNSNRIE